VYVSDGETRVLVDAGLSFKTIKARLSTLGIPVESIDAVLFTHDHVDHCSGIATFCRQHPVRIFANEGTASGIEQAVKRFDAAWDIFENGAPFAIGGLTIEAFSVPHDASDPVAFVIADRRVRLGVVTDLGMTTALIDRKLASCDALVLESNHDPELRAQSGRPWPLIQRIRGPRGHLNNADSAALIAANHSAALKTLLLAHLSEQCNTPALAFQTMRDTLRRIARTDIRLELTHPDQTSVFIQL